MTVLVLSEDLDPSVDAVLDLLNRRGVPVLRCDLGWFPQRLTLDAQFDGTRWDGELATTHRRVRLSELTSVWYRHPSPFTFPDDMSPAERRHSTHEAKIGIGGVLWALPGLLWVNHPAKQADVYKPTQLAVAARSGLMVPKTRITNRAQSVRDFADANRDGIVLKQLSFASINEAGGRRPLFTKLLTEDDLSDLAGVEHTAHLVQQWVDKDYDARVTVVGNEAFAAGIGPGSEAARVDFRADYDTLHYWIITPPADVTAGIHTFMRHFGLSFGAFDFAVDRNGVWWFLECNPGGQYGFIETEAGLPISEAIADLLQKGMS